MELLQHTDIMHPAVPETWAFDDIELQSTAQFHSKKQPPVFRDQHLFVVLMGPSSVGKSTLIAELNSILGNKLVYPTPLTTRDARINDDKQSVSDNYFDAVTQQEPFLHINHLYGAKYGVPLWTVRSIISKGKIPILDFPLQSIPEIRRPEFDFVNIYLFPQTVNIWKNKLLSLNRNSSHSRLVSGLSELHALMHAMTPEQNIDLAIVNKEHQERIGAQHIAEFVFGLNQN